LKEETSVGDKVSLVVFTIIFPTEYYVLTEMLLMKQKNWLETMF